MAEALHRKNMIDVFDHFPEALFAVAFVVRSFGCSDFIAGICSESDTCDLWLHRQVLLLVILLFISLDVVVHRECLLHYDSTGIIMSPAAGNPKPDPRVGTVTLSSSQCGRFLHMGGFLKVGVPFWGSP